jgi:integrase
LKLLALTFVRPGELRKAEWSEFDFDRKIWTVTADHTKKRREHLVPLSAQALALLRELKLHTSGKQFLFPAMGNEARPMSENTMNAALHRMGFTGEMVSHGFRASADSMLSESGDWSRDAIDRQMQHVEANKVKRAYNRSEFLPERTRLMQSWANMLDGMRTLPAQ